MLEKLSCKTVVRAVIENVINGTGFKCFDYVPANIQYPYYFVEIIGQYPEQSKTMWKESYDIAIHCCADGSNGSLKVYELIDALEIAMTDDINIPDEYDLVMQTCNGMSSIINDVDGSKRAIVSYKFTIFYGYKVKI